MPPPIAVTNEQAKAWCLGARKLLKALVAGKGGDRGELKDAVAAIEKVILACEAKGFDDLSGFTDLQDRFRQLGTDAEELRTSTAPDKAKNLAMKGLLAEIKTLSTELKVFESEQSKLATAQEAYDLLREAALAKAEQLKNLNIKGNTYETPLETLLDEAEDLLDAGKLAEATAKLKTEAPRIFSEQSRLAKADKEALDAYPAQLVIANKKLSELQALKLGNRSYDQPLIDLMKAVADMVDAGQVAAGVEKLKAQLSGVVDTQVKAAKTARDQDLQDVRFKPVYLDKVGRIEAAIKELEPLPGTKAQCDKLAELKNAGAAEYLKTADYEKAYDKLSGLSGALEAGRKAAASFSNTVGDKDFRTLLAGVRERLVTYDQVAGLAFGEAVAEQRQAVDQVLKDFEVSTDQDKLATANRALGTIDTELKQAIGSQQEGLRACEEIRAMVDTLVTNVRAIAPVAIYETELAQLRLANTQFGLQNYAEALKTLKALRDSAARLDTVYGGAHSSWTTLLKTVDEQHLETLRAFTQADISVQPQQKQVADLLTAYSTVRETVVNTHLFADAVVKAQAVIDGMPGILTVYNGYKLLDAQRKEQSQALTQAKTACTTEIDELKKQGGAVAEFMRGVDEAVTAYRLAVGAAMDAGALTAAIQQAQAALQQVRERVRAVLDDPAQLERAQGEGLQASQRAKVDESAGKSRKVLARLAEEYPEDAQRFRDRLDVLLRGVESEEQAGKAATPAQLDDLATLLAEIEEDTRQRGENQQSIRDAADRAEKACSARVDKLRRAHSKFSDYFDALAAEVKDARGMAKSSVNLVVVEANGRLSVGGDVYDKISVAEASRKFDEFDTLLDNVKNMIGESALGTCAPKRKKTLKERLDKEVTVECYRSSPEEAVLKLMKFAVDVDAALTAAKKDLKRREEMRELKTTVTGLLQNIAPPALKNSLVARVEAAAAIPAEGREYDSVAKLQALKVIAERFADPDAEGVKEQMTEMAQQATARAFEQEKAGKEWLAKVDVFEKNLLREAKAVYKDMSSKTRDEARMKSIDTLLDEGKDLAKKSAYTQALAKLDDAIKLTKAFLASPYSAEATTRNSLGKVDRRWRDAVAHFAGNVNALAGEIVGAKDGTDDAAVDIAAENVRGLTRLFDPLMFAQTVTDMTAEGVTLPALRRHKEDGLRFVRRYQEHVAGDPLLLHVSGDANPFDKHVPLDELRATLADLELNLKRA